LIAAIIIGLFNYSHRKVIESLNHLDGGHLSRCCSERDTISRSLQTYKACNAHKESFLSLMPLYSYICSFFVRIWPNNQ